MMEEQQIVELYWQRSEDAVGETARRFGPYCLRIAVNILGDPMDGEECVNDTYLRAWEAMPPHRPRRLSAFLGKITRNLAINRLASRKAQKRGNGEFEVSLDELLPCIPAPRGLDEELQHRALTRALDRFLWKQAETARMMFVRRYFYCDSIEAIATQFGCSQSKVKSSLFRTRNQLKLYLEKEGSTL